MPDSHFKEADNRQTRHIRLLMEYDGSAYEGWQTQRSRNTIQDILAERIRSVTGEDVRLLAASRTDAGVHAFGQVAVFETFSDLAADVFRRALNAGLPEDIRILLSEETGADFHPRYDARGKRYFYLLAKTGGRSVFLRNHVWHAGAGLDFSAMKEAAAHLMGQHDFSSFRGSGCSAKTTIRTVSSIEVLRLDALDFMTVPIQGDFIKIVLECNAFLRHMARNIVGTLVEIGRGRMSAADMAEILAAKDRTKAGPTAPARGLFLEKVFY